MAEKKMRKRVNRLPAEQRIADIMIAAQAVFTTKGYESALISDIAERAGVVDGSIYRFFANKRESGGAKTGHGSGGIVRPRAE